MKNLKNRNSIVSIVLAIAAGVFLSAAMGFAENDVFGDHFYEIVMSDEDEAIYKNGVLIEEEALLPPQPPSKQIGKIRDAFKKKLDKAKHNDEFKILIHMKDKADISAFKHLKRKERGKKVINELRQVAQESQASLVSSLNTEKAKGKVKKYRKFWIANIVSCTATKEVIDKLSKKSDVYRIYEDKIVPLPQLPDAGDIDMEKVLSGNLTWGLDRINAATIWEQGYDGTGIIVGSLDTGVYTEHPDLIGKMANIGDGSIGWYDAFEVSLTPVDDYGHGTHTIGTIVGGEDNDSGITIGVAAGAKYYSARIFMHGAVTLYSTILDAAQWMMDPDNNSATDDFPAIINNSWGSTLAGSHDEWFRDMVNSWRSIGIIPVFSAGNKGPGEGTVSAPGNYPESFCIGATDITDAVTNFSSRGPAYYDDKQIVKPDIVAPGAYVISALAPGTYESTKVGTDLCWLNGTSMAAPHVAGVCALLKQKYPEFTVDDIINLLCNTAANLGDSIFSQGSGRLDLTIAGDAKVIFNPRLIYFGEDDEEMPIWTKEMVVKMENLTVETLTYTLSVGDLPTGITAEIAPSEVTLPPDGGVALTLSLSVDNTIVPDAPGPHHLYQGEITAESLDSGDTATAKFMFKKATYLKLTFDIPYGSVFIHDQDDWMKRYSQCPCGDLEELKIDIPKFGVYDVWAVFENIGSYRIVVRENIQIYGDVDLSISFTEASNHISVDPKDKDGNHVNIEGKFSLRYYVSFHPIAGFALSFFDLPYISDVSDSYILDWSGATLLDEDVYCFNDSCTTGITSDITFGNEADEFNHVEIKYNNYLIYSRLYICDFYEGRWSSYSGRNEPIEPFIVDYYFCPDPRPGFLSKYSSATYHDDFRIRTADAYSDRLYITQKVSAPDRDTIKIEVHQYHDYTTLFETKAHKLFFGFGPPHFTGKMDNSDSAIMLERRLGCSLGLNLYNNQMYDMLRVETIDYELYKNDTLIDKGSLDLINMSEWEVSAEPAIYRIVLTNQYLVAGAAGQGVTTLEFDTASTVDKNPPHFTRLQIWSNGDIVDSIDPSGSNVIKFQVGDDSGSVQPSLYYRISGGEWVELLIEEKDDEYVSTIPFLDDGPVDIRIKALDGEGNSITYELQPAFYVSDNPEVNQRPIAVIESITPNPVIRGGSATLTGVAFDYDGTIDTHNWFLGYTCQTFLESEVTVDNLQMSQWVYFKARDDCGIWSEKDIQMVWVVDSIDINRPDYLEADSELPGTIDLEWGYYGTPPEEVSGYRIYYSTDIYELYSNYYQKINFIDVGDVNNYTLTDLDPELKYYIAVSAYGMIGGEEKESVLSHIAKWPPIIPEVSIQKLIDAAHPGDAIYVPPGIYEGDISIKDKDNIKLIGEGDVFNVIIIGNISFENSDSSIENFTILYGTGEYMNYSNQYYTDWKLLSDAGITAINSEITVKNCIIMPDPEIFVEEEKYGKGIQIWNLYVSTDINPMIENNLILNADTGIYLFSQAFGEGILGTISNNTLDLNTYGIVMRMHKENLVIHNNIITRSQDALHLTYDSLLTERLDNIANNCFGAGEFENNQNVWCDELQEEQLDLPAEGPDPTGNIGEDPDYVNPENLDYYPQNENCEDKGCRVGELMVADFTAYPTEGDAPLTVDFTNLSTPAGEITGWEWDFNNDTIIDSTDQYPEPYTYNTAGDYTVSLKVTGLGGSDTETKIDYIHVSEPLPPEPVTLIESFEDGWGEWLPDDDGHAPEFRIELTDAFSGGPAYDGKVSVMIYIDGAWDDGTAWVERAVELLPNTTYSMDMSFQVWSECYSEVNQWYVVAYCDLYDPETEDDFLPYLGQTDQVPGWKEYAYSKEIQTDDSGRVYVACGISCVWETPRTYYLDFVTISFIPSYSGNDY